MIEAEHLNKYYGNFQALKDVHFQITDQEIVGFLGPNGAGKSTTMRILTGFIPPSSGTVRINGFDIQTRSLEARKQMGYLPENVPLYKDMPVKAFLGFLAAIRGLQGKTKEARIEEIIQLCRLQDHARTPIAKLSKGYRQLVGIAQAIVHKPEVLILDEPTIGIDPRQVVQIREMIKDYGRKHTVILSSHILPEVRMVCDRIMVMDQGRIKAVDRPENLASALGGPVFYEIEAQGDGKKILTRLRQVGGVSNVQIQGKGKTQVFVVESHSGQDIRDELTSAVKEDGSKLLGLTTKEVSLEDIFLRLTDRDKE
ncbi:MAG: ABC transporter ATP-binding protein [Thermodesulfobacteriota bacterium]